MLNISLAAETLWTFRGLPISNSLLTAWIVMAMLTVLSVLATRKLTMIPGSLQVVAESVVGGLHDFFGAIAGKNVSQFFPIVASLFLFILLSNWVGLLPGVGTVGFFRTEHEKAEPVKMKQVVTAEAGKGPGSAAVVPTVTADAHAGASAEPKEEKTEAPALESTEKKVFVPLFRAATSDLNMTLALAIVAVVAMQYFGFRNLGAHYGSRFVSFKDPINFFVGILEVVSDLSKIVSFAFRLFGNIFAGEVLLAVIAFLMPFLVPLPFLLMELFVGLIQALVFSMLSTAFFAVAVSHGEGEHAAEHAA